MKISNRTISEWSKEIVYLIKFTGTGVINTFAGFAVIFFFMWLGFSPIHSNIAGYIIGFLIGFVLSKNFVFASKGNVFSEGVRYVIAFITSFLINLLILYLALYLFNYEALISQIIAAIFFTVCMYVQTRLYVFKDR